MNENKYVILIIKKKLILLYIKKRFGTKIKLCNKF